MHNNSPQKKLSETAQLIFLTPEEKKAMRFALQRHMRGQSVFLQAWRVYFLSAMQFPLRAAVVVFLGIFVISGTILYRAQNALPGDVLYTIKIEVNERAWGLTALSYESQAEWSVERTTRRLQELEQLATSGTLDEEARNEITSRFEQQAAEASKAIVKLKTERMDRAAGTSSQLDTSRRVHERSLMQVVEGRQDISDQLRGILETVREKAKNASAIRMEIEQEIAKTQHEDQTSENTENSSLEQEQLHMNDMNAASTTNDTFLDNR